jgi:hypothetical protein
MTMDYFRRWYERRGGYRGKLTPWRRTHLVTIAPRAWYRLIVRLALKWLRSSVKGGPWLMRFRYELLLREYLTAWWCRVGLWPRWWLSVLSGRSFLP